jgi:hypothetical protein
VVMTEAEIKAFLKGIAVGAVVTIVIGGVAVAVTGGGIGGVLAALGTAGAYAIANIDKIGSVVSWTAARVTLIDVKGLAVDLWTQVKRALSWLASKFFGKRPEGGRAPGSVALAI